jgi:hypothetical protein
MEQADPWMGLEQDLHEQWCGYLEWVADYEREEQRMGITANQGSGKDFKQVSAGSHIARCIKLTDLGTQQSEYQGVPNSKRQVLMTWEIPGETMEIEGAVKPMTIGNFYTLSLNEKANLRKHLEQWRGVPFTSDELDGFELKAVLGKPCMLSIIHVEGKARVSSVSAIPKGMEVAPQFNVEEEFSLDDFDVAQFDALGQGLQKIIMKSPEYKGLTKDPVQELAEMDDDIPF